MIKFYVGKFIQYFLIIIFTISLNFFLPRMMPGDPLQFIVGDDVSYMVQEKRVELLERHGLNKPLSQQYINYFSNILRGDLGYSYRTNKAVTAIILERLPWTLLLSSINILLSTLIGTTMGALAAWNRSKRIDIILNNIFVFLKSMPSFWVGMILIAIIGARLGWLPIYGAQSVWARYEGFSKFFDIVKHLIMPTATLVILSVSNIYLTMRYSMIDVLGEDYILMAKMKGLSNNKVRYSHAMRTALIPVVTVVMLNIGYMVGGSTIVETVFSYPGIGRLLFDAVVIRDYPVMQGCFFLITICVIGANIIADLVYPFLDPKVV